MPKPPCLRDQLKKLLEVSDLPSDEREAITFMLTIIGDDPGDDLLADDVEAHYRARYRWYYDPKGNRRTAA